MGLGCVTASFVFLGFCLLLPPPLPTQSHRRHHQVPRLLPQLPASAMASALLYPLSNYGNRYHKHPRWRALILCATPIAASNPSQSATPTGYARAYYVTRYNKNPRSRASFVPATTIISANPIPTATPPSHPLSPSQLPASAMASAWLPTLQTQCWWC